MTVGAGMIVLPEARPIPLRNAWLARAEIRMYSSAANDWTPYIVTSGIGVRLSRFESGYDFSGYPSTLVGPVAMAAADEPGWYYGTFTAEQIDAALSTLVGQTVYQITEAAYGTSAYALTITQPLVVVDPRFPIP